MPPPTTELDTLALTALRRGAAMAHSVAGLTVRLCADGATVATVGAAARRRRAGHPAGSSIDGRLLGPCAFRTSVARVWADHQSGRRVAITGCHTAVDLDWSIDPPGRLLGFGGVRWQCAGAAVWTFASVLPAAELAATFAAADIPPAHVMTRVVGDRLLDVSVAHLELSAPSAIVMATLDDVTRDLVAANTVAELVGSSGGPGAVRR